MSQRPPPNFYAGPYLDRRAAEREAADWLRAALEDAATLFLASHGTTQLLRLEPEPAIAFLTRESPAVQAARPEQLTLLGWFRGVRCVQLELTEPKSELAPAARFEELRPLSPLLAGEEAGLLAYARALTVWRSSHRFCGRCGAPTWPERAGHALRCSNAACAEELFPRIDPAIIVLVSDGERALLGRQATWPAGRYSTIAGFVEPGESLEDAVAREVREETGVPVLDCRYHSSQPWPFPSSLMLGFHATAPAGAVACCDGELEDARWFTRDDIASGSPRLPTPYSISYRLIEAWFDGG